VRASSEALLAAILAVLHISYTCFRLRDPHRHEAMLDLEVAYLFAESSSFSVGIVGRPGRSRPSNYLISAACPDAMSIF
jgi:hypothetical protein